MARTEGVQEGHASGALSLHRAVLADRLHRKKLAEKQYRKAVDCGTSYFAWWRLLKHYEETAQPKAVLVCLAEILDRAEEDKVRVWEGYQEDNFDESDSDDAGGATSSAKAKDKKKKKKSSDKNKGGLPKKVFNARTMSSVLSRYPPWIE